ncbi:MAG: chemotaxis protein CheA [Deltaproteobacteria bacterium]|nr:chemotaxis protein CheA [Deltaproteobacteria bacterium]
MKIDLARFRETFFEEAAEHVATLEQGLLGLERPDADPDLLNSIFRAAHSIKGGSGTFGLEQVASFSHVLENVLDRMREGTVQPTRARIDLLLRSTDVLKGLLVSARSGEAAPAELEQVLADLQREQASGADPAAASAAGGEGASEHAAPPQATNAPQLRRIHFRPASDVLLSGLDPILVLRDLASLGEIREVTCDTSRLPSLTALDPEVCHLAWTVVLSSDACEAAIRDVFAFVEDGADIQVSVAAGASAAASTARGPAVNERATPKPTADATAPAAGPAFRRRASDVEASSSIRVSIDKVDRLVNLVGELVIAHSMVADVVSHFTLDKLDRLQAAVSLMGRNTREMQERVMGVRMMPIGSLFGRFPRMVRELSGALGKDIQPEMSGEETELDKAVVERIGDPLTHLVRNAVDHGIDDVETRRAHGKPEQGVIRLAACTQGGSVIIEVADDGRGLDKERIHRKAVERGLARADEVLTDEQLYALILQPAFSTADKVTDLSGRGVGLDVVKRNVEALNGSISITTTPGRGTSFRIKLPLTLAILDGQVLLVGEELFVLPLVSIVESLRPKRAHVKQVFGDGEVVMVRGDTLPLIRAHRLLGVPTEVIDPCEGLTVIVEHEGRRVALLVDDLRGQQQVVIKGLDVNYRRVEGVLGATVMGDGRVAFILDVAGLIRMTDPDAVEARRALAHARAETSYAPAAAAA